MPDAPLCRQRPYPARPAETARYQPGLAARQGAGGWSTSASRPSSSWPDLDAASASRAVSRASRRRNARRWTAGAVRVLAVFVCVLRCAAARGRAGIAPRSWAQRLRLVVAAVHPGDDIKTGQTAFWASSRTASPVAAYYKTSDRCARAEHAPGQIMPQRRPSRRAVRPSEFKPRTVH